MALHRCRLGLSIRVIIAAAVIWVLFFLSNTIDDYMTRGWLGFPGKR